MASDDTRHLDTNLITGDNRRDCQIGHAPPMIIPAIIFGYDNI